MNENEMGEEEEEEEEEEKRRMDVECGGTYVHRTTTMKRILFSFSLDKIFLPKKKMKECQTETEAAASDFISDIFLCF